MIKKIYVLIVAVWVIILIGCQKSEDYASEPTGEKIIESSHEISDDVDYIKNPIDIKENNQWSLSNQGTFPAYSNNDMAWEFDERKACKG